MIELTRLNGGRMIVNCDLIRYAEASPDTVITLVTGDKIVVSETLEQLVELVIAFRSSLLQSAYPNGPVLAEATRVGMAAAAGAAKIASEAAGQAPGAQLEHDESWRRRRRLDD